MDNQGTQERGEGTKKQIADLENISQSRISQLWNEYKDTGEIPELKDAGRPQEPLSRKEKNHE